jgi:signal transduction histidine kinase
MSDNPKVLIVDDTPSNRRLYGLIVADAGAEVVEAASGEEALKIAAAQDFAMILLDVSLPGMDGFDTAHRLRQLPAAASTPIVFVSAVFTGISHRMHGFESGAVDYLTVPVMPEILRAKVQVFARLHLALRQCKDFGRLMERQNRELRVAYDELEAFSYAAAHDLRAPLRVISGFAQAIGEDYTALLDAEGRQRLERIAAAAERMGLLIDDLLQLSRVTRSPLRRSRVDLTKLAHEVAAELQAAEPGRAVQWRIAKGMVASCDAGLLRIALDNLLGNAWKYTAKTKEAQIDMAPLGVSPAPTLVVRDNGAGFDAAQATDRVFKPFQRFHKATDYAGTGIGLAIVRRIVERHGGQIRVEAAKGKGAAFFFTLGEE